jgi:signal peptidase I
MSQKSESDFDDFIRNVFPQDTSRYKWTIKDFGPLYIPAKGDNLPIDSLNIILYRKLIEYETGKSVSIKDGLVFIGDSVLNNYTFRQDYYFVAGDWIFDSMDSRYWGLLPDDLIVGKAAVVWKSVDPNTGKFRWNRFFNYIK